MNCYCFTHGSYSDYGEEWYSHAKKMDEPAVKRRLATYWPAVLAVRNAKLAARDEESVRVFGVKADDIEWHFAGGGKGRVMTTPRGTEDDFDAFWKAFPPTSGETWPALLAAAGFVALEPCAKIDRGDGYSREIEDIERLIEGSEP